MNDNRVEEGTNEALEVSKSRGLKFEQLYSRQEEKMRTKCMCVNKILKEGGSVCLSSYILLLTSAEETSKRRENCRSEDDRAFEVDTGISYSTFAPSAHMLS